MVAGPIRTIAGPGLLLALLLAGCDGSQPGRPTAHVRAQDGSPTEGMESGGMPEKVVKSDAEWRQLLTPEQYRIMRRKGTEPAFSGKYYNFKAHGVYRCAACGNELFSSEAKYDSGSGWPSFWKPINESAVATAPDGSLLVTRTEVLCSRCGAHLGHVFEDGPLPTGLRYCVNSAPLDFVSDDEGGSHQGDARAVPLGLEPSDATGIPADGKAGLHEE